MADHKSVKLFKPTPTVGGFGPRASGSAVSNVEKRADKRIDDRPAGLAQTLRQIVELRSQKSNIKTAEDAVPVSKIGEESFTFRGEKLLPIQAEEQKIHRSFSTPEIAATQIYEKRVATEAMHLAREYFQQQLKKRGISDLQPNLVKSEVFENDEERLSSKRTKLFAQLTDIVGTRSHGFNQETFGKLDTTLSIGSGKDQEICFRQAGMNSLVPPSISKATSMEPPAPVPNRNFLQRLASQGNEASLKRLCEISAEGRYQASSQLTIFYAGTVYVYDDIPEEKAKAILVLANSASNKTSQLPPKPVAVVPEVVAASAPSTSVTCDDLPQARKASLQRFLEKRKDRFRVKAPVVENKRTSPPRKSSSRGSKGGSSRSPSPAPREKQMVNSNSPATPPTTPKRLSFKDEAESSCMGAKSSEEVLE